jgi:hypothetical protein
VLAGLGLFGVLLSRRRWWPWLTLPVLAAVPSLAWAGDLDAALAGLLAVGITAAGGLALGRRWWPPYLLIAAGVLLLQLLAPDAYAAFGSIFLVGMVVTGALAWARRHRRVARLVQRAPAG